MAFQFKIQLKNITNPPVWRRVIVPGQFTFLRFHHLIQTVFGWGDYHLFLFSPKGYGSYPEIKMPDPEDDFYQKPLNAAKTRLSEIFSAPKQKYIYIYDFGDDWKHEIVLEKIIEEKILLADCIAGKGACPPEDCGGSWGYANLKEILNDPKDPQHDEMEEWLGMGKKDKWNAEAFDLEAAGKRAKKV